MIDHGSVGKRQNFEQKEKLILSKIPRLTYSCIAREKWRVTTVRKECLGSRICTMQKLLHDKKNEPDDEQEEEEEEDG